MNSLLTKIHLPRTIGCEAFGKSNQGFLFAPYARIQAYDREHSVDDLTVTGSTTGSASLHGKTLETPSHHRGVVQEALRRIEDRKQSSDGLYDSARDSRHCNRNGYRDHDRYRDRDLDRDRGKSSQSDLTSSRDNTRRKVPHKQAR